MGLRFIKLLKTHVEKMSAFRLSMIFMKTNELDHSFQDVDENKCVSQNLGVMKWPIEKSTYWKQIGSQNLL